MFTVIFTSYQYRTICHLQTTGQRIGWLNIHENIVWLSTHQPDIEQVAWNESIYRYTEKKWSWKIAKNITCFHPMKLLLKKKNVCFETMFLVTRILTTLRFWPEPVKTPHFLLFCKTAFSALYDETLEEPFFQLPGGCCQSFWSVMAIDPLVDSIPELSIYGRASAVLHLTGTKFLQVIPK